MGQDEVRAPVFTASPVLILPERSGFARWPRLSGRATANDGSPSEPDQVRASRDAIHGHTGGRPIRLHLLRPDPSAVPSADPRSRSPAGPIGGPVGGPPFAFSGRTHR